MKSLSRGRRDYGTVPTALPLMPPSGTLMRRQRRDDLGSSLDVSASFSLPWPISARETRSALSIPRFYHLELVRLSANGDGPTTAASSHSKIVSVPPAMHFPEFLRSVARVLRVDPTVALRIAHKDRTIESLPALHSVPAGALLQIGLMPELQRRHQRQQQQQQDNKRVSLPTFVQVVRAGAPKGTRPTIVELGAFSTWAAILKSFKVAVGANELNDCNLSLQNNVPIHSLSDLAKLEGGAILLLHEIEKHVLDEAYPDPTNSSSPTQLLETLGHEAMDAINLLTTSALGGASRSEPTSSSRSSTTQASSRSSDTLDNATFALANADPPTRTPPTTATTTSDKFLTSMPWKRLYVVYILAPPGAEEVSLANELALRRGYTPIVLEHIVAAEIEEGTSIGRDLLNEFSAGQNGLTPNIAAILVQKAITNTARALVHKWTADTPKETPLEKFIAKEARERATAAAAAQSGHSVQSFNDAKIFHAALQQRFLLVGFPPSVHHDIMFSKMVAPCRHALFLEMSEEECVRALLGSLNVPLRDNNGAITTENRGGYAGHRRKLEVRRRVQRKMKALVPVLHHLATQGKLRRLEFSKDSSVMKNAAIRRIMPIDPEIYREASRMLSPVPMMANGGGPGASGPARGSAASSAPTDARCTVRPRLATSRALVVSAPISRRRQHLHHKGEHGSNKSNMLVAYPSTASSSLVPSLSSLGRPQSGSGLFAASTSLVSHSPVRPHSHTAGHQQVIRSRQQPSPRTRELIRRAKHVARKNAFKYIGPPVSSASAGSRVVLSTPLKRATLLADVAAGTVKLDTATTSPQRLHSDVDDAKRRKERLNRTVEDEVVLLLLAWLRSLQLESCYDLTHTTDNWRRDFANGWVVSLLLRRYFPSKFPNEAVFVNGASSRIKRQNWLHIVTFLRTQMGVSVPMNMVSRIILAKKDAVRPFLLTLHQALVLGPQQQGQAPREPPPRTIGALSAASSHVSY